MKLSFIAVVALLWSSIGYSQDRLFQFKGKTYSEKDLNPAQRQSHFEIEMERYGKIKQLAEHAALEMHIDALAKKRGRTHQQIEEELFKVGEASDKEVAAWFDKNKHRLPPGYKLDQIKGDIKNLLKGEKRKTKRDDLLAKLSKSGGLKILLVEPKAPRVAVNYKGFPAKGSAKPKVRIVEFADYQCPHCKSASAALKNIVKKYSKDVQLVYMDYPINRSGVSRLVAEGAYCADKQNKYWEYHDLAFRKQKSLKKESPSELAKEVQLNLSKFQDCIKSKDAKAHVERAKAEGDRVGVGGTPTIFINGQRLMGHSEADIEKAVKKAL